MVEGAPPAVIGRALAGLLLIDPTRLDPRDLSWATAVCAWGVRRVGLPREETLHWLRLGSPSAIDAVTRFLDDEIELSSWGFVEVTTSSGPGLADTGYASYEPTSNLLDAALAFADAVENDRYVPATITVANDLPPVWFGGTDEQPARNAVDDVRATIAIHSMPRPDIQETAASQMLLTFLSECANSDDARNLAAAARAAARSHHTVAVQRDRFLATLIAKSTVVGTASVETDDSIQRFAPIAAHRGDWREPLDRVVRFDACRSDDVDLAISVARNRSR